jgi:hypothetical protein
MSLATLAQSSLDTFPLTLGQTRRTVLTMILQNLHVIIIILVALSGVVGRVAKAVRDVRKERERALAKERAEIDALRTGRASGDPSDAMLPSDPEAALNERRRRIEQARRAQARDEAPQQRQQQRDSATQERESQRAGAPSPQRRTRFVRLPGGVVIEVPEEALPPQARSAPQQAPQTPQAPSRPRPAQRQPQKARPQRPSNKPTPSRATPQVESQSSTHRLLDDAPEAAPRGASSGALDAARAIVPGTATRGALALLRRGASREEIRRAFVLAEVLGPPRGMRSE